MSDKPLISFDYAIKYLLKSKGDYDIVEGFISALLATEGYKPIKINALLESESNKESAHLKKSIADLVVQDENDNKYIVEIERSFTPNFMHKACFNTSRLVVDSISGNQDYTTIKKVFHISLLYFSTREMKKPIYHGKTIIHEIDTSQPVTMRVANQGLVMFEHKDIFPEYFFISIPLFDELVHQEIDEWLYMMKHSDVKSDFKSPYMKKVQERLAVLKMSDEERGEYYQYLKEAVHSQDVLTAAEEKGEIRGIEKGKEEAKLEIAKNLLASGMDTNTVASITKLTKKDVEGLESEMG
ncbi:Rpn family recombination-promoting nuclease/putative transposase [Candidatus Finniella inopinata]|uniref:Rpn family recombination-promoting nuclease/putative transposase n=1 Tax=Candidatus Finniella inopinata TaxID=1696036 RepID=A0A4V2DZL3_9PROT|nr:Rpn family recombination-promoting nuclease/putative transposase [Candidatus Finniella inopinata]RZI45457.1 Rpn family recombination-promoting nuclease/putative transposase [Candidatus Finniella inopinata]